MKSKDKIMIIHFLDLQEQCLVWPTSLSLIIMMAMDKNKRGWMRGEWINHFIFMKVTSINTNLWVYLVIKCNYQTLLLIIICIYKLLLDIIKIHSNICLNEQLEIIQIYIITSEFYIYYLWLILKLYHNSFFLFFFFNKMS